MYPLRIAIRAFVWSAAGQAKATAISSAELVVESDIVARSSDLVPYLLLTEHAASRAQDYGCV